MFDIGCVTCSWQVDNDMTLWLSLYGNTQNIIGLFSPTCGSIEKQNTYIHANTVKYNKQEKKHWKSKNQFPQVTSQQLIAN